MLPFNMGAGGASSVDTGDIGHSLRFRSAASAYLSRTPAGATDRKKWTFSAWVKRGSLGSTQIVAQQGVDGNNFTYIAYFNSSDQLVVCDSTIGGGSLSARTTNAKYRDPSAFLHIVVHLDAANTLCRVYVNGVEQACTGTQPSNVNYAVNFTYEMRLGRAWGANTSYLDGYVSRVAFVDGSALDPSSFGYFNTEINEWVSKSQSAVKAVVDAGGTNSFMLDFDDPNFATYNVGKDYSSKGNHWTPNNFSLTAGTSYDWMLDVPGNSFATLNPLIAASATFTEGNLKYTNSSGGANQANLTPFVTGMDYYVEAVPSSHPAANDFSYFGSSTCYYCSSGKIFVNGSLATTVAGFVNSDVVGIACGQVGGTKVYKNGTLMYDATTAYYTGTVVCNTYSGGIWNIMAGQAPLHASATYHSAAGGYFRYTPPSGYKALCQRNLPDPAILNPGKHFDVQTYTGDGTSSRNIGTVGLFKPDFAWIKARSASTLQDHVLVDSVRGGGTSLYSNATLAEQAENSVLSFYSTGLTIGNSTRVNQSSQTYVEWAWKAGGAPVTNNAGSISSQVSANVEAGFSIVTYTGTGANATVGHGLGKAPGLVIVRCRNAAQNWAVSALPTLLGSNSIMHLNGTAASSTADATIWNSTYPTSSVFSIGTNGVTNGNTYQYVAYCFAEIAGYSSIFSYTGNGSADGPFVHCGFKPKFVMLKNTAAGNGWIIWDAVRDTYNIVGTYLQPNVSTAEGFQGYLDFQSNGFKLKIANADANGSGNTIVGIAFADVPGKYSLAR